MAQRWELMGMTFESNILFLFREGLVSCVGYTAIYFAGVSWGEVVFAPKSARKESLAELKSIGRITIDSNVTRMTLEGHLGEISFLFCIRRNVELSYVVNPILFI